MFFLRWRTLPGRITSSFFSKAGFFKDGERFQVGLPFFLFLTILRFKSRFFLRWRTLPGRIAFFIFNVVKGLHDEASLVGGCFRESTDNYYGKIVGENRKVFYKTYPTPKPKGEEGER